MGKAYFRGYGAAVNKRECKWTVRFGVSPFRFLLE